MKVILLQDIKGLGKKYEVKEVAPGYAKNFLIPKGLAKLANKQNLNWLKMIEEKRIEKTEEELKRAQEIAAKLDGYEFTIQVRVGERGQLFESISKQKIAKKIKEELGFEIKKNQIILNKPIKELGEFPVLVKLDHNLEAEVIVIVVPSEE